MGQQTPQKGTWSRINDNFIPLIYSPAGELLFISHRKHMPNWVRQPSDLMCFYNSFLHNWVFHLNFWYFPKFWLEFLVFLPILTRVFDIFPNCDMNFWYLHQFSKFMEIRKDFTEIFCWLLTDFSPNLLVFSPILIWSFGFFTKFFS